MPNIYRNGNCHGAIPRKVLLLSHLHVGRLERVHILQINLKLRRQRVYIHTCLFYASFHGRIDKCEQRTLVGFLER
jgi:hypothetical protein